MRPARDRNPKRSQSIAARIFTEVMEHGSDDDRHAARLLSQVGIQVILDDNRFGLQPKGTILNGCLARTFQITNLRDCIWNAIEDALNAKETNG